MATTNSGFSAKVGIAFSCRNLPNLYHNINAVTSVHVYVQQYGDKEFEYLDHTEVQIDTCNPDYEKIFYVDYYSRRRQYIRLDVWDVSSKDGVIDKHSKKLGSVTVSLVRMIRMKGQPLLIYLLNDQGEALDTDACVSAQAVSIRRERKAPEAPPPPPKEYTFVWRRVREWTFNEQERYHDWTDIPREMQTVEKKTMGKLSLPMVGKTYYDLMQLILAAAGLPKDPPIPPVIKVDKKTELLIDEEELDFDMLDDMDVDRVVDEKKARKGRKKDKKDKKKDKKDKKDKETTEKKETNEPENEWVYDIENDPEWDSELEDEVEAIRRMRKEEEMTPKELALRHMHNTHITQAYLTQTVSNTTKQVRVISTCEDTYNPTLEYLHDHYLFGVGLNGRCLTSLHSHGFIVYVQLERTSVEEHKELLERLSKLKRGEKNKSQQLDWHQMSKNCAHCRGLVEGDD